MKPPTRYHPVLVTLHWLVAILVLIDLYIGLFIFLPRGHTDLTLAIHMTAGLTVLAFAAARLVLRRTTHSPAEANSGSMALDIFAQAVQYALYAMLIGVTVLGLVFAVRTNHFQEVFLGVEEPAGAVIDHAHPEEAMTPQPTSTLSPAEATAEAAEYGEYADEYAYGAGTAEPDHAHEQTPTSSTAAEPQVVDRTGFTLQALHLLSARILLALIGMHVLAALYHQVMRKDDLLRRMWYR